MERGEKITEEERAQYAPTLNQLDRGNLFLDNVDTSFRTLFEQAAKYADKEDKERTNKILNHISMLSC